MVRKTGSPEASSTSGKRRRGPDASDGNVGEDAAMRDVDDPQADEAPTATPRRRGRPKAGAVGTPVRTRGVNAHTPGRAADRSARKKSVRALISLDDDDASDSRLAREICGSSEGEDESDDGVPATPSRKPRGRPKSSKTRARSPTPPRDLPRHELYFADNKPGRPKTSDRTLAALSLLSHDEYFAAARAHADPHAADVAFLESLHAECFPQWMFELSQGFSVCLFGLGSKRRLLHNLMGAVHRRGRGCIVVVNGYAQTTALREVLSVVAAGVGCAATGQPASMLRGILAHLSASTTATPRLTLAVHSIDAAPLRRPGVQAALAQLAAHPRVHLVCSADTPDFPLLWDMGLRSAFNFAFHDCTTFAPLAAELDVVDHVHELLGRQALRVNGRDGVVFVLRSLTENAKNLFRLLVGEVLVVMEEDVDDEGVGLEYRSVYNKAVQEFICTSEMAFRTLLKEFHDHQMIVSRKDALGTELLSLPFRKEDLEAILEDLSG